MISTKDYDFLDHMIKHHNVAVLMSRDLMNVTNDPVMLELCRKIILDQDKEIFQMTTMLYGITDSMYNVDSVYRDHYKSKLDFYNIDGYKVNNVKHDSHFFNYVSGDMNLDRESYLRHMIPHHQIAVDMSKSLLLTTKNSHMITLCRNIIQNQQNEILYMNQLLNNKYHHSSILLNS